MLHTLAVTNYRSLRRIVMPLSTLTVITGPNGSGKSNLYRSLSLLASVARGDIVGSLAREGGLTSTLWAGPEKYTRGQREGTEPVQGTLRADRINLKLGFAGDELGYAIDLGVPAPGDPGFDGDPAIKREVIWAGPRLRPSAILAERRGRLVRVRGDDEARSWDDVTDRIAPFDSMLTRVADPRRAPEVLAMRDLLNGWRFYHQFRADEQAPARTAQIGTWTPVLSHDGRDLASALLTIREIGDASALEAAVDDFFPGATVSVLTESRFGLHLSRRGLLRPLTAAELSDGTLRGLLWIAALLTPRPPELMVLNEPETSLHPDLLPALARLIIAASRRTQVWVVTHAARLAAALEESPDCSSVRLETELGGETRIAGQRRLDEPPWDWPKR